jgi:hypothetical protein
MPAASASPKRIDSFCLPDTVAARNPGTDGDLAFKWKREVEAAAMTSKSIIFVWVGGGTGAHVRPRFAINPAAGALEATAEFRLETR